MTHKKQSAGGFETTTADTSYIQIIAYCTCLSVKLASYLRGLA